MWLAAKEAEVRLKTFMKEAGGVNACAELYSAKQCARVKSLRVAWVSLAARPF